MKFEGPENFESQNELNESVDPPMSREALIVKNGIQTELIKSAITSEDVEEYPLKWIEDNSDKFHRIFVKTIKQHPDIIEKWQDENSRNEIVEEFKQELAA